MTSPAHSANLKGKAFGRIICPLSFFVRNLIFSELKKGGPNHTLQSQKTQNMDLTLEWAKERINCSGQNIAFSSGVNKTRNMEHSGTPRNIPEKGKTQFEKKF